MKHASYLESKVLTAPPQRLHLMLIEGAIRFGRQAEAQLRCGNHSAAVGPLLRTIDIVGELLAGVRTAKDATNKKIAELYWFLFRRVTEAKINGDAAALDEALRLLEFERETWQLVCEKLNGASPESNSQPQPSAAFTRAISADPKSGISYRA
jgi:flagellar protein FliS